MTSFPTPPPSLRRGLAPRSSVSLASLLAGLAISTTSLPAQQAASPTAASTTAPRAVPTKAEVTNPATDAGVADADPVSLSPFEVRSDTDQGYLVTSAQSGTRLRSDMKDIAAAVSVVTKDFMNDIGARNLDELLVYTLNTEVGGVGGNFSEAISTVVSNGAEMDFDAALRNVSAGTRVRGLLRGQLARLLRRGRPAR